MFDRIRELYPSPNPYTHVRKVEHGFLSENHVIESGGKKYFLKKYRFPDEKKIKEIHAVKKYFSGRGIPVILPIENAEGKTYFSHDTSWYALFPFVDGRRIEKKSLTDSAIASVGDMCARLHLAGRKPTLRMPEKIIGIEHAEKISTANEILSIVEKKSNLDAFDRVARETVTLKLQMMESNKIDDSNLGLANDHLLHGDYHDQNVFFDTQDRVSWVFDFEKASMGPRVYELIRAMDYCGIHGNFDGISLRRPHIFLRAYNKIYPISREEFSESLRFYYLKTTHNLWVETEHYLRENTRADSFLGPSHARLIYFRDHFSQLKSELMGDL